MNVTIDEKDAVIFARRAALVAARTGIQSGDWVVFADGTQRRVSHVWEWGDGPEFIQTSDGGSWYLGEGYASFSGGLHPGIKPDTFTDTGEWREGSCWIFHHGMSGAGRGIDASIPFRVWSCSEPANQ